jgi:alkanesulfonate monooxygenase SsuD/methylene tetrahydromethanopterin reductase-like flavin-dependent oxidoreductase (luciferase family)
VKFDTTLLATNLSEIPQLTRQAEAIGFDGIWVSETAHDAFLPLVLVAEHSKRVTLGTSIAVAFPRSPAILAYIAWDLAKYSQGRTVVGLGTQTNSHFQ